MIQIDSTPYASAHWYSGTYTRTRETDSGEVTDSYEFSLCHNTDENTDSGTVEITWTDLTPDNWDEIEADIKANWGDYITEEKSV